MQIKACESCGDTMRSVSYVNVGMQNTLWWCGWCAKEFTEVGPVAADPVISAVPPPPSFAGLVKLESTRVGPHGGKTCRRIW
jgi:hypothetical protein